MNNKNLSLTICGLSLAILMFSSFIFITNDENKAKKILITTDYGNIKIKLYNETPLHRDNFLKLVKEHYFDSLLFHRVIKKFMIQGGDPDSKYADDNALLGDGGPDYTIPKEFNQKLFHKKGVLAAARESDLDNILQASSGSQFYIVQGKIWNDSLLKIQANRITKAKLFNEVINRAENKPYLEKYKKYNDLELADSVKYIQSFFDNIVAKELPNVKQYQFTKEQIKAYTTIGGTPHLDDSYTVFGEVYEGLEVVDKIAELKTDNNDRPLTNVRMKITLIE